MKNKKYFLFVLGVMNLVHTMELPSQLKKNIEVKIIDKYEQCPICQEGARNVDQSWVSVTSCCQKFICRECKNALEKQAQEFKKNLNDPEWRREYSNSPDFTGWPTQEVSLKCPLCRNHLEQVTPAVVYDPKVVLISYGKANISRSALLQADAYKNMVSDCASSSEAIELLDEQLPNKSMIRLLQMVEDVENKAESRETLKRVIREEASSGRHYKLSIHALCKIIDQANNLGIKYISELGLDILADELNSAQEQQNFLDESSQRLTHGIVLSPDMLKDLGRHIVHQSLLKKELDLLGNGAENQEARLRDEKDKIGVDQASLLNVIGRLGIRTPRWVLIKALTEQRFTNSTVLATAAERILLAQVVTIKARNDFFKTKTLGCDLLNADLLARLSVRILKTEPALRNAIQQVDIQVVHPEAAILLKYLEGLKHKKTIREHIMASLLVKEMLQDGYLPKDHLNGTLYPEITGIVNLFYKPAWNVQLRGLLQNSEIGLNEEYSSKKMWAVFGDAEHMYSLKLLAQKNNELV